MIVRRNKSRTWLLLTVLLSCTPTVFGASTVANEIQTPSAFKASSVDETTATQEESVGNDKKSLTLDTMSQTLKKMEYAVRGKVVIAADRINDELQKDDKKYPFDHIVYTNIGNPHSVGQKPLTWPRQVLALVDLPDEVGVDHPEAPNMFPADVIVRAREIKKGLGGKGTGAYSHSKGVRCFRDDIAAFVKRRDGGVPCDPEDIFLTNGASGGITMIMETILSNPTCGVMIPIPQYPIYTALIELLGAQKVGYYLDEENNWNLNVEELERSLGEAKKKGVNVVAFVLINPGNPTGQVLSKKAVQDICKFCAKHKLVLLADEVYQENIYDENCEFVSCKRAAHETGLLERNALELISFHSISKGLLGECGRRGGYMELVGMDQDVKDQIYKLASANLCSTLSGQVMMSLMVRGPEPGDESYERHEAEKEAIYQSLRSRAKLVRDGLSSIPGIEAQPAQGAMYSFPRVEVPAGAVRAATEQGTTPDTLYALSLLEHTGICVVPASGFGQEEGRCGFRITFLPPQEELTRVMEQIKDHHQVFCKKYGK